MPKIWAKRYAKDFLSPAIRAAVIAMKYKIRCAFYCILQVSTILFSGGIKLKAYPSW